MTGPESLRNDGLSSMPFTTLILLTLGGAVAGFSSVVLTRVWGDLGALLFPGALFGIVLAIYLRFAENRRTMMSSIAIVSLSISAAVVAFIAPLFLGEIHFLSFPRLGENLDGDDVARRALTISGLVGAAVLSPGFCAQLQSRASTWRVALEVMLCTVVGGWLAGRAPGLLRALSDDSFDTLAWTIILWQTGMAWVLGVISTLRVASARPAVPLGAQDPATARNVENTQPG